jgi:hypothetical protein
MSYYPYYGYPYRYGYPYSYPYGYPYYPYSLNVLNNNYKLGGLYNELDELNDVAIQNGLFREMHVDVSCSNPDLNMQLKQKNHELVQHIVLKNSEIEELRELLKQNNIDCSMNDKGGYYHRPRPRPRPHPYPYPHPWHCHPYCRRDSDEIHNTTNSPQEPHVIIPRAISPELNENYYIIPPNARIHILPGVLPGGTTGPPLPPPYYFTSHE